MTVDTEQGTPWEIQTVSFIAISTFPGLSTSDAWLTGARASKVHPLHSPQHGGEKVPEATSRGTKCSSRSFRRQQVYAHTFFIIKWKLGKKQGSRATHCHCYLNSLNKQGDMFTFWEGSAQLFLPATHTTVAGGPPVWRRSCVSTHRLQTLETCQQLPVSWAYFQ